MEFLESSAGTCTFAASYVIALEWASTKYRVLGSALISLTFSIGEVLLGVTAMYVHNFRYILRILYTPGLLVILYFWIIPESVRWLLVTGQTDRAIKILKRIAKVNGKELSDRSIELLKVPRYAPKNSSKNQIEEQISGEKQSFRQSLFIILKSKTLFMRFIVGCYIWMTCCYCYYGLSLTSMHIPGNDRYMSFIAVTSIEIPGLIIAIPLLSRISRRKLMFALLTLSGLATIVTPWVPEEKSIIVLLLFMLGKGSITCAFNVLYIYTAEIWPTNLRTTMMNLNSMIGRIGGMVAPLTPLLVCKITF